MIYKFCENHLADLYEAIKNEDLAETEKVEHQLTIEEECVACAYSFKAKGSVKGELLSYLKSQGFELDVRRKESLLDHFYFWFVRVAIFTFVYLVLFSALRSFILMPWLAVIPSAVAFISLLIFTQIFD